MSYRSTRHGRLAPVLMLLSGFAGLGYQILWTQQFALSLGAESASVLAVVAAFFAGLAAGALLFGARIESSRDPRRWYALAEAVIGAWCLLLVVIAAPLTGAVLTLTGPAPAPWWQWSVAFGTTFLLLLPATAARGVTVPAMERMTADGRSGRRSIAGLYAMNTLGAVVGVLAIALWLIPAAGLRLSVLTCAACNGLAAGIALLGWRGGSSVPASAASGHAGARAALLRLAVTGFVGIGYEMVAVRVLSQVAEDTVYTFALLLAVYLIGTTLGAALYRRAAPASAPTGTRTALLVLLSLACLVSTAGLYGAEWLRDGVLQHGPGGLLGALAAEAAIATLAFALPTVVMGALFSQLCNETQALGVSFGRAIGINTLGAAVAPVLVGVVLIPLLGLKGVLVLLAALYALLALTGRPLSFAVGSALAACAGFATFAPRLAFIDAPQDAEIVSYRDGPMASVSVIKDSSGVSRLRINNRQQEGANADRRVDGRQALLPLLLHPAPRRVLFLGVGAGNTAATAAETPGVTVDAVELLPEVIDAATEFTQAYPAETRARLHFIAADARRYVKTAAIRYDVIVADNYHPARSGTGTLYTVEHFAAIRDRLEPGGVFCQWLPLHQLDLATLKSIVRSFLTANPDGYAILASNSLVTPTIGLVAHPGATGFDPAAVRASLNAMGSAQRRAAFGVEDEFAVLGAFIGGPRSLERWADPAPLNTDDHPVVAYGAPRVTYAPDSTPAGRLAALLGELSVQPAEMLAGAAGDDVAARLGAYFAARRRFIELGTTIRPTADPSAMLDQLQGPLLQVLRISSDFRPAYDPLLHLGAAIATSDPGRARALFEELARTAPRRPEAGEALRALGP